MRVDPADSFWSDGACCVRGAVPADTVRRASAAVDSLSDAAELADLTALAGVGDGPRFAAGVDHWRRHPEFAALATEGALPAIAASVLRSQRLWLYEDSVLVKQPGVVTETRWHTDDGYFHVEGEHLATMWVPLDPAPLRAGALRFVRGSHADGRRYRPTLFVIDDPIPGTIGEQPPAVDADDARVFGFDLDPGDCTVHHARTLHAAGGNRTDHQRRALSIRYCGDDAVVRVKPGAPGKPGFDEVADGTPIAVAAPRLGLFEARLPESTGESDR